MYTRASKRFAQVLALLAAASLAGGAAAADVAFPRVLVASGPASPAAAAIDPEIDLCATTGSLTLAGGTVVPIWGFVTKPADPGTCADVAGTASLPGPVLHLTAGEALTLNVTATGDLAGRQLAMEIPGLDVVSGPNDTADPDTKSWSFEAPHAGTYLYQSVGDGERQTAMGLYGALIVASGTAGQAYDTAGAYDVQATLVLSAIDPAFNAAPDTFDMKDYRASYWLIDGKSYPDTDTIHATAGQRVLLRYVNAGFDNTTMMLVGMDQRVIARDAHLVPFAYDAVAETIPAGQTEDTIATVPAQPSALTHGFPLFNRQLHVSNGTPSTAGSPGGMLTFIAP